MTGTIERGERLPKMFEDGEVGRGTYSDRYTDFVQANVVVKRYGRGWGEGSLRARPPHDW